MANRFTRAQWLSLLLLVLAGVVNFLDRSSLSIAATPIRSEMHLSARGLGVLLSAFTLAYGFAQLPLGPALDRFGSWKIMTAGLGIWSTAQMLTGAVFGMRSFIALRVLLGLGEAPFFPASVKLVRERFDEEQRGRAISAVNVSTTIGQATAPALLTILMLKFGWRVMFALLGGLGIVLAMVWVLAGRGKQAAAPPMSALRGEWGSLFKRRAMWGMMLGFGGVNYTAWFYISWLPTYLQNAQHLSIAASGWLAVLPFLGGSVGMLTSGFLADMRAKRGGVLRRIHLSQIITGMTLSAACTLMAVRMHTLPAALTFISCALFCIHFAGTSAWGYAQAASEREVVATVSSLQNFGSFLLASVAPLATGWLLDRTQSFVSAFVLCGCVALIGAGSYALLVKSADPLLGTP
ncbi:MAG TPA: MFS transporter [Acidobacteriaceae bacterium]